MACTRTLKIALVALAVLAGLLIVDLTTHASEKGFTTIAGGNVAKTRKFNSSNKFRRHHRKLRRDFRTGRRSARHTLLFIDGSDLLRERNSEERIRRFSHLRNKVSTSPRRPGAKIIRVTERQKQLGEARAAIREARMIEQIDKLDIRFYRDTEAYDARFPSIVYLEMIEKE